MPAYKQLIEIHRLNWNGILIEISYNPVWTSAAVFGEDLAHIEVRSIYPTDAPLPITETGYRSHFLAKSIVDAAGGPVDYVSVWLETEKQNPHWLRQQEALRQPMLF